METELRTTTPRLHVKEVGPSFNLVALDGRSVSRSAYRGRRHLALIFLHMVDLTARTYLHDLIEHYAEIRASDGEVLAIVCDSAASAEGLAAALDLPFPLLLDPDCEATKSYLPDGAQLGVFILDRYGALHKQWVLTGPPLPPPSELAEWITVLDRQCVL